MDKSETKRELKALVKAAEKNRVALQTSWQKAEDLEAAIQSVQRTTTDLREKRREKSEPKA